jgi:nucleotide-binding universal stress UspA family protein
MFRPPGGYPSTKDVDQRRDTEVTITSGRGGEPSYLDAGSGAKDSGRQQLVVVGVDSSAAGAAALRWAVDEAQVRRARILAIAVSEPPLAVGTGLDIASGPAAQSMIDDELAAAAGAWLADALEALPVEPGQAVERLVARGDAATVLLEAALDADMLVLGNHGRGPLVGALAGSVAQRCAHHAECPLVLIPAPAEPDPGATGEPVTR